MAIALFILGYAGSGKSKLAKRWIKSRLKKGEAWAILDKDLCAEPVTNALLTALGVDPKDRDSLMFKSHARDLEYQACVRLANEQLQLGVNVVLPGPWTKEVKTGVIFNPVAMGFPEGTEIVLVYLDANLELIKNRIFARDSVRDEWKKKNWEEFSSKLARPPEEYLEKMVVVKMPEEGEFAIEKIKIAINKE